MFRLFLLLISLFLPFFSSSFVFVIVLSLSFASTFLEPRKVLPIFKTDEPICPEGKLSCGNGECIEKELFCNGKPDCKDESDENACSEYRLEGNLNMIDFVYVVGAL